MNISKSEHREKHPQGASLKLMLLVEKVEKKSLYIVA